MAESRMAQIEKSLAAFLRGVEELRESQQESWKEFDKQMRKSRKEADEQMRELRETLQKMGKRVDQVMKSLGDLGLVQGEVAEDLFYRNLPSIFRDRKPPFHIIKRNLKKKGVAEYDIVATDGNDLLVVEVKNKLKKSMIDEFINKRLPGFKKAFPQYQDCRMTGGIGALVVKDEVGRYAENQGLYVLTQTDDGGAALLNRKTFKPKEFA